ncbi:LytR cell envelope-related transcriptional attenuator [Sphingomonas sp. YR710]|uniref:LytR C-terminal domain-containing protein n=1 Tax=Sphingomonas sp. YR710 TaxID=1882773 RepID=UPI00088D9CFE|nr:LytR C-terminal domain-containing protein [Sphingomonas sp. YR710]SDD49098.1 LytR cell envelope-related transcriptional attenuator [Sphingomonas sp. YR710]
MKQKSALLGTLLLPMVLAGCAHHHVAVRVSPLPAVDAGLPSLSLAKGKMLFARGEYALALECFQRAVREDPAGADGYNGLAASYDQLGRFDLSRRYYELALARAPEDVRILRNLARSLDRQGDQLAVRKLMDEVALLTKSTAVQPDSMEVARQPMTEARQPVSILTNLAALVGLSTTPKMQDVGNELDVVLPAAKPAVVEQSVSLRIVNAVGRRHLAAHMRGHLTGSGWATVDISDFRSHLKHSLILVSQKDEAQAQRLAASLPFTPKIRQLASLSHMILVLGGDSAPFDDRLRQEAGS